MRARERVRTVSLSCEEGPFPLTSSSSVSSFFFGAPQVVGGGICNQRSFTQSRKGSLGSLLKRVNAQFYTYMLLLKVLWTVSD